MNMPTKIIWIFLFGLLVIGFQNGFSAPSLNISTSKNVYQYGDYLTITFRVSELTGDPITVHIIDSSGKTSSPIPIDINELNKTITAPVPFYKTNYSPGLYQIDAEYSGTKNSTSFNLIDSDKIAIPSQYKTVVKAWFQGTATDKDYAGLIRELIHFEIIKDPNYKDNNSNPIHISPWFKNDAKWWSEDIITDSEFGNAIQYLLQKGVLSV